MANMHRSLEIIKSFHSLWFFKCFGPLAFSPLVFESTTANVVANEFSSRLQSLSFKAQLQL